MLDEPQQKVNTNELLREIKEFLAPASGSKSLPGAIKKPTHWKRRTIATYYKEKFALEFRAVLDEMIADEGKHDKWYFYDTYCRPPYSMTKQTLYSRIYQSMRFLIEPENKLDPDGKYTKELDIIQIDRTDPRGIRLGYMHDIKAGAVFAPASVEAKIEAVPKWKEELDKWLSKTHDTGERLVLAEIILTDEDIESLRSMLDAIPSVSAVVVRDSIKVVKIGD